MARACAGVEEVKKDSQLVSLAFPCDGELAAWERAMLTRDAFSDAQHLRGMAKSLDVVANVYQYEQCAICVSLARA